MSLQVQTQHNRDENNTHFVLFVRSGAVNLERNSLRKSGDSGYFWSSVAFTYVSPTFARSYHVYFDSGLHPTGYGYRFIGFPVRCLVY